MPCLKIVLNEAALPNRHLAKVFQKRRPEFFIHKICHALTATSYIVNVVLKMVKKESGWGNAYRQVFVCACDTRIDDGRKKTTNQAQEVI